MFSRFDKQIRPASSKYSDYPSTAHQSQRAPTSSRQRMSDFNKFIRQYDSKWISQATIVDMVLCTMIHL